MMNVQLIKKKHEALKKDYSYKSLFELVESIAVYIIQDQSRVYDIPSLIFEDDEDFPPEHYISTQDFERRYAFISHNTLKGYCRNNKTFQKECAFRYEKMWFIDPKKTYEFFKNNFRFKKRLSNPIFQEKINELLNGN